MPDAVISIVYVEDSQIDADLVLAHLEASGVQCRARRVETRQGFVQELQTEAPDVILSDFSLPHFDGRTALQDARDICPEVPFLFVSGVMGEEVAIEMLQLGATDYVLKQRLQRLVPALRRAIREAEVQAEARRAAQQLRLNEERLRIALNTAGLGDWEIDLPSGLVSASPLCRANYGLSPDERFTFDDLLAIIHPGDRSAVRQCMREAVDKQATFDAEYRVRWPDDSLRWLLASGRTIYDDLHRPQRMVGVTLDITARKTAEVELARQAWQLQNLNADLEQFAYAASHDLQEPLRNISSFAALLSRRFKGKLDEEADEFIDFIISSAQRMNDLLTGLLAYSRLPVEDQRLAPVDMNVVFRNAVDLCWLSIQEAGAQVTADPLPTVEGHSTQLGQVLQNLISNAIKYRSELPPIVHVSAKADGTVWKFKVADNGQGFDPQYADRIFGLFKRLHRRRYPGTGLGLAICKRIIERHSGRIWAESIQGQGSQFYFTLPSQGPLDGTGDDD